MNEYGKVLYLLRCQHERFVDEIDGTNDRIYQDYMAEHNKHIDELPFDENLNDVDGEDANEDADEVDDAVYGVSKSKDGGE